MVITHYIELCAIPIVFSFLGLHINTVSGCITIPTTLLMCSVDLPARSMCANTKLDIMGVLYQVLLCFMPIWQPGSYKLRTHQSIIQNAREGAESHEAVCTCITA